MVHPKHQFKKEGSNRSLPPSLESLLMKRYGIYDITAKSVVMKGRKVLKMARDEAWTEKLEDWCHAFLSTQLVDPAFLAAQRLRQMSSAKSSSEAAVPAVAASTVASRRGKSNPKSQKGFWSSKKTASRPSADDMLDYKRESSQKKLMQQKSAPGESLPKKMQSNPKSPQSDAQLVTSSMESLPKKPVRKQSNPKGRPMERARLSQRSSMSPSDELVLESRRASLRLRESPPSGDESPVSPGANPSNPATNQRPRMDPSDTSIDRIPVSRGNASPAPLRSRTVLCRPQDSVERPWKDMSLNKQASQKSLQSVSMPQRKKSPARGILKNVTESEMDIHLAPTVEVCPSNNNAERSWKDVSLNKQASQRSLQSVPMPQRKKSPARGILRNKKSTETDIETELECAAVDASTVNALAGTCPAENKERPWKDMSLNKQASQKSLLSVPLPQRKKSPARGILRNKKTAESELDSDGFVRVTTGAKAVPATEAIAPIHALRRSKRASGVGAAPRRKSSRERPILGMTTSDDNLSYASSLTYPSLMMSYDDLYMDRWSAHSAPPRLETPTRERKQKPQAKTPERPSSTRRRWTPNRMMKRIDHTPKRPHRLQDGSHSTMDTELSDDIPMEVRVYPIEHKS